MISAALAEGSATLTRGEAQVMRRKPCRFIEVNSAGLHRLVMRSRRGTTDSSESRSGLSFAGRLTEQASRVEQGATCINGPFAREHHVQSIRRSEFG